jgi:hypothetical protein
MVKQKKGKRICVFAFLFAFVCILSFFCPVADAQPKQHVVQKEVAKTQLAVKGIDMSDRIDLDSVGYLSLVDIEPLGRIDSAAGSKLVIGPGDEVFVDFGSRKDIIPGEVFSIAQTSDLIRHPITNKPFGYVVSIHGTLTVKEYVKNGMYLAEVGKTFAEVLLDDIVIPRQTVGSCIQPMPTDPKLYGNVIAVSDNRRLSGQYAIVFLDGGFKDGIQTGCVFDVVRLHKRPVLEFKRYPLDEITKDVGDVLGKSTYLDDFTRKVSEGRDLYEFSVGKLIVLEAKPDTAIGIVVASKEEFVLGAFVKGMPWVEPPDFLASLPTCLVK